MIRISKQDVKNKLTFVTFVVVVWLLIPFLIVVPIAQYWNLNEFWAAVIWLVACYCLGYIFNNEVEKRKQKNG